jgi:hypothetical protein
VPAGEVNLMAVMMTGESITDMIWLSELDNMIQIVCGGSGLMQKIHWWLIMILLTVMKEIE